MFRFMLAPMEDYSDAAFRKLCFNHGADLTFTEMAKMDGLIRDSKSTSYKVQLLDHTPTQIQILPSKDEYLKKYLAKFKPSEGFKGFNFNLGCPAPNVQQAGQGCAMVKRVTKAKRLISIARKYNYPVSLKIRLGSNDFEKKMKVYLNLINGTDPDFFIVHVRTGQQKYSSPPDYSVLEECVQTGKEIIANGSLDELKKINLVKKMGVKGVMIGRAAVQNPAIFDELNGNKIPSIQELKKEYSVLAEKYNAWPKYQRNILDKMGQPMKLSAEENKR